MNRRRPKVPGPTENPYFASRFNAVKYGVMIHGILPCRGEDCVFREGCEYIKDPKNSEQCKPGYGCPAEATLFLDMRDKMLLNYLRRCPWLEYEELRKAVNDFCLIVLRNMRLSQQIANEGFLREVRGPNGETWKVGSVAVNRYMAALDNEKEVVWNLLHVDPTEEDGR